MSGVASSSPLAGASASTAGDDFHELWALKKVLELLDPRSDLARVIVEGVPTDEAHAQLGDRAQAADVTLFRRAGDGEEAIYEQLKYSVANPDTPWTWARLFKRKTATRAETSVIIKLTDLYSGTDGLRSVRITTNQPLSLEVSDTVPEFVALLRGGGGDRPETLKRLSQESRLSDAKLADFLDAFDLTGFGSASRLRLETDLLSTLGQMTDADARDDLRELHSRVAALILPENRKNATVDRETLLAWLGAGAEAALYPAPSNFTEPEHWIERRNTPALVDRMMSKSNGLVRLSAEGGCGKTAFMTKLKGYLPAGSETVLFDCYGGGLFLSSEDRRHLPSHAFAQVANELAGLVGSPFVLQPSLSPSLTAAFVRRVQAAAEILKTRGSEALLVIVFDAADNARIGADRFSEACFLDELAAVSSWPANVRVILTCRPGRAKTLGPDKAFTDHTLEAFSATETRAYIKAVQPSWPKSVASELHDLTGGVARRLVYAVDDIGAEHPQDAIKRLMPKSPGIDPLFLHRVQEASLRLGDDNAAQRLLCALAHLPRPMPTWALAEVSALQEGDIQGVANDLGGLLETAKGWSFHDEDFEAFADTLTASLSQSTLDRACVILETHRSSNAYAAHALAEAYLAAGQTASLFALAHSDPSKAGVSDEGERRALQMRRLALALRAAGQASDAKQAQALLLTASKAIRTSRLLVRTISGNLELSSLFSSDEAFQQVAIRSERRASRGELRLHLAAAAAAEEPSTARNHLRWWCAWAEDALSNASPKSGSVSTRHLELEFEVHRRLSGLDGAVDHLISRWKPKWRLLDVADRLIARALMEGRFAEVEGLLTGRRLPRRLIQSAIAQLLEHGRSVGDDTLHEALRPIVHVIRRSRSKTNEGLERLAAERALILLEAAAKRPSLADAALRVLDRCWPVDMLATASPGTWEGRTGDIIGRVIAVRDHLTSSIADLAALLPKELPTTPLEPLRKGEIPTDERLEIEARNKEATSFNARRKSDFARLTTFVQHARDRLADVNSPGLDSVLEAPVRGGGGRERDQPSDIGLAQLRARDLASQASPPVATLAKWIMAASHPSSQLRRLEDLVNRTGNVGTFLNELVAIQATLHEERAPASRKVEALLRGARMALGADSALARNYYNAALKVADDLDIEAIEYLLAASQASEQPLNGSNEDRRAIAERLPALGEEVYAALGDDVANYMPWGEIVSGSAAQHFPTALATVGRWRDDGFVDFDESFGALLDSEGVSSLPPIYQRVFRSWSGFTELPVAPSKDDVEAFARNAVLNGRLSDLTDDQTTHLASLASTLRAGRWAKAMEGAASFRPSISAPSTTPAAAVANPIRTDVDLRTRLQSLDSDPYVSDYTMQEIADDIASPVLRVPLLNALSERTGRDSLCRFLSDILPTWRGYPPVNDWIIERLPDVIAREISQTVGLDYRDPVVLFDLLGLFPTPDQKLKILLKAVELHGERLAPEILVTLAGVIAQTASATDRLLLVVNLLNHTDLALGRVVARTDAPAPDDLSESVSRWLFAMMADVDKRVRWRAAHAARDLLLNGDPAFVEAFISLLDRTQEPTFANPKLVFYGMAARLWLSLVLHRIAHDAPVRIQSHADAIAEAALAEPAHILIRSLLKDTALALESHHPGTYSVTIAAALRALNIPRMTTDPKAPRFPRRQNTRRADDIVRYDFDDSDTRPYWFSPAAGIFGLDIQSFEIMAERWILDEWGAQTNKWQWVDEPRADRFRHLESSMASHRHGSEPTVEHLSRYFEWHAMCCVLGELVATREAVPNPYGDTLDEWITDKLLTDPGFWLSDLLGPPPPEERFWQLGADWNDPDEQWLKGFTEDGVGRELRAGKEFVISAGFSREQRRTESVSINSALVTPTTSLSLAAALEAVRDPMDFKIPEADDHDPINKPGFRLEGWLNLNQRDARLDESDPDRRSVKGVPIFPSDEIQAGLGLKFEAKSRVWKDPTGETGLSLDLWDREHDQDGEFSGWRLRATPETLATLLNATGMSLIVEVAITRRLSGDYAPKRRRRIWRMFVIHSDMSIETPNPEAVRLGRYWVRKLGLDSSVDTYGRWLINRMVELDLKRPHLCDDTRLEVERDMSKLAINLKKLSSSAWL